MDLAKVWMWYCEQQLVDHEHLPPLVALSPMEALDHFFDIHPMFPARHDVINSVDYDTAFDEEADAALCQMAKTDDFECWSEISAGCLTSALMGQFRLI